METIRSVDTMETIPSMGVTETTESVVTMETTESVVTMETTDSMDTMETSHTLDKTFPLNYDCSFELFKRLGLNECMSLAEAFDDLQPVADWMFKLKFNNFSFDFKQPIDRILYHAGPTIDALSLNLTKCDGRIEFELIKIGKICKKLKSLRLSGFDGNEYAKNPFVTIATDHLKSLTLNRCANIIDEEFFDTYRNLKSLNFFKCRNIEPRAIVRCLRNNQAIKNFSCESMFLVHPVWLRLLPNLERLTFLYDNTYMNNLNSLSTLLSLRHLTLHSFYNNVNHILANLLETNILEEIVLINVEVDLNTFKLIRSFRNLKLLAINSYEFFYPDASDLPTTLKSLKFGGFLIRHNDIIRTVERLVHLENIHLEGCDWELDDAWVSDFDTISGLIVTELDKHTNRQLNVAVTSVDDETPETVVIAGHSQITNYVVNPKAFKIAQPGMDD